MAGKGSSVERLLAMAQRSSAKKRGAEASPPQPRLTEEPQAGAASGGTRSKGKKKRAKGGEADPAAVDPDDSHQVQRPTQRGEPRSRPVPAWLDRLSEAAYGDPFQACKEVYQHASARVKQAAVDRKEKEQALERVKELEGASEVAEAELREAREESRVAREELRVAREELRAAREELKLSREELKLSREEVNKFAADQDYLKEENERLNAQLEEAIEVGKEVLEDSFKNAIQQVEFRYPEMSIDRSVVHYSHVVLGDRIERRRADGTVVVVYKAPGAP